MRYDDTIARWENIPEPERLFRVGNEKARWKSIHTHAKEFCPDAIDVRKIILASAEKCVRPWQPRAGYGVGLLDGVTQAAGGWKTERQPVRACDRAALRRHYHMKRESDGEVSQIVCD